MLAPSNLPPAQLPSEESDIEVRIREEQLRQAQHSFNLSFVVMLASAILGFASVGLLLHGKTTAGVTAASASLISTVCQGHLKFSRDTNQQLNRGNSPKKNEPNSE